MSPPKLHSHNQVYHDLSLAENDEAKGLLHTSPQSPSKFELKPSSLFSTIILVLVLVTSLAILAAAIRIQHLIQLFEKSTQYPSLELRPYPCGLTPEAARAAGCVFDLGSASWLPEECIDYELSAAFEAQGPWSFYHNTSDFVCGEDCYTFPTPEQLVPIPDIDAVSEYLDYFVWTDQRYHVSHCMYSWKLMHRQIEKGRQSDQILGSWEHTRHCVWAMNRTYMEPLPLEKVMTAIAVSFPNC